MTKQTILTVVVSVIVAVLGTIFTNHSLIGNGSTPSLGANGNMLAENYIPYVMYNGGYNTAKNIQIGTNGTSVSQIQKGTCSLVATTFTVSASTTVPMDCAITGVVSTDTVFAMFATSTQATTGPGWEAVGASASSTAGFITISVTNGTGASAVIPAAIASSTQYLIIR